MITKEMLNDGTVAYYENEKKITLRRGDPVKLGRLPDYVWRYLQPAQQNYLENTPDIHLAPDRPGNKKDRKGSKMSNYTAPRKRTEQKKIA